MNAEDIARQRSLIATKVKALKDLYAMDELSTEDYQREMIAVQARKRKLRTAQKNLQAVETANLPAVVEGREKTRGRDRDMDAPHPTREGRTARNTSTDKDAVAQYDSILQQDPQRQCTATNVKGERCRRYAILGGRVCTKHGGATRHVKEAARVRVEMESNRLMGKLIEIAYDDARPATVQLDAIKDSLNRAGLTKPTQIEVGPAPHEEIFSDIFSGTRAESRRARGIEEPDSIAGQPFSEIGGRTPTAPAADAGPGQSEPTPTYRDSDSDPLAAPQRRERRRSGPSRYDQGAMTGEDAIASANEENYRQDLYAMPTRERRALPPGKSGYR